jgi:RNA polymerase sigma factor (sigma-70 family)
MCDSSDKSNAGNPDGLSAKINFMAYGSDREKVRAWADLDDATRDYLDNYLQKSIGGLDDLERDRFVQDTLLTAFIKAFQYRGETDNQAKSWLRTIAKRKALNYVTSNNIPNEIDTEYYDAENSSYSRIEDIITAHDWKEFLGTLGEREKSILEKKFSHDIPQIEIAEDEKISPARVSQIIKYLVNKAAIYFGYKE